MTFSGCEAVGGRVVPNGVTDTGVVDKVPRTVDDPVVPVTPEGYLF